MLYSACKKPLDVTLNLLEEIGVCEGSTDDNQTAHNRVGGGD